MQDSKHNCLTLESNKLNSCEIKSVFYFHSLVSPRPALCNASDRQHAVRVEGLQDHRAVDAHQAVSEEEQRDDKVGNTSTCGNGFARGELCVFV